MPFWFSWLNRAILLTSGLFLRCGALNILVLSTYLQIFLWLFADVRTKFLSTPKFWLINEFLFQWIQNIYTLVITYSREMHYQISVMNRQLSQRYYILFIFLSIYITIVSKFFFWTQTRLWAHLHWFWEIFPDVKCKSVECQWNSYNDLSLNFDCVWKELISEMNDEEKISVLLWSMAICFPSVVVRNKVTKCMASKFIILPQLYL